MFDREELEWAARVHVLVSPDAEAVGKAFLLPGVGRPLEIGRSPGPGGLAVDDSALSRRHARVLELLDGSFRVEDLRSTNGTYVDRVALVGLIDVFGDAIIRIGRTLLHVGTSMANVLRPGSTLDPLLKAVARDLAGDGRAVAVQAGSGAGVRTLGRELHRRSRRTGPLTLLPAGWTEEDAMNAVALGPGATALLHGAAAQPRDVLARIRDAADRRDTLLVLAASRSAGVFEDLVHPDRLVRLPEVARRRAAVWGVTQALFRERFGPDAPRFTHGAALIWLCAKLPDGWATLRERFDRLAERVAGRPSVRSAQVRATLDPVEAAPKARRDMGRPTQEELEEALLLVPTVTGVADHFGRTRRQVYRWMDFYGIERPKKKNTAT